MSEQQQREQIDKRHQFTQMMIYPLLSQEVGKSAHEDRGQLLTWLRERDVQIASLQRELARFQRADVGERVREIEARRLGESHDPEQWHDPEDIADALLNVRKQRDDVLDICRQQAAEIETYKRMLAEAGLREGEYRDRLDVEVREHLATLQRGIARSRWRDVWQHGARYYRARARQLQKRLRAYEDEPTDRHERCEREEVMPTESRGVESKGDEPGDARLDVTPPPVGKAGGAPDEEYRPGLPPVALLAVHTLWEEKTTGIVKLTATHHTDDKGVTSPNSHLEWQYFYFRPVDKSWPDVEQEAARAIGAEDAKAGRDPWRRDLCDAIGPMIDTTACMTAYAAAYDAAKGG